MKPYAQMTPRERLIDSASSNLRRSGKRYPSKDEAHLAIEGVIDGCSVLPANTYGGEMYAYYHGISQNGLERLICAVIRASK